MSFMFNPYPFEDTTAVNRPKLSQAAIDSVIAGDWEVCRFLSGLSAAHFAQTLQTDAYVIGVDGYVGAAWGRSLNLLGQMLEEKGFRVTMSDVAGCYRTSEDLEQMLKDNLPLDAEKDPISLFGKLFHGEITEFFDERKLDALIDDVRRKKAARDGGPREVVVLYGHGAASARLVHLLDTVLYYDVTPMHVIQRTSRGKVKNIGDTQERSLRYTFRRLYYVDFEVEIRLREHLLKHDLIDYYLDDNGEELKLVPKEALNEIFSALVRYPFRCKPVYLEGVWGGHFIQKLRELPGEMKNCAWVFDLIPSEVSLLIEVGRELLEVPFPTFFRKEGVALMGEECVEKYHGGFPIRFNYDDTWHGSGNMSIQVHPTCDYSVSNFGERFQQDESYYVVATGHDSKTYLGLTEDTDVDQFFAAVRRSEKTAEPVAYESYINSIPSRPGDQFLIPAGTVHASGRNQVVLEIGSLTVGSYTFKIYDYVRLDLDGKPRPIHSWHAQRVLQTDRRAGWVEEHLHQQPRLLRQGEGWAEYVVGEHESIYFSLRRLEFDREIEDDTKSRFHVLVLVDGERVVIQAKEDPNRCFEQKFLEMVVVPASFGKYIIKNLGHQPIRVHKTLLK